MLSILIYDRVRSTQWSDMKSCFSYNLITLIIISRGTFRTQSKTQWTQNIFKTSWNCLQTVLYRQNITLDVYKTTATNCKGTPSCIAKISNRRLIKMSTQDVSKKSFKDVFWKHLLKLKKNKFLFHFYLLISCFFIFCQNVVTTLSFWRRCSKKCDVFITRLRRRLCDQVSTLQT